MRATLTRAVRGTGVGVALAFSWLTVLPVRGPGKIDRAAAARAIAAAPLVGLCLGAVAAGALWGLTTLGMAAALAGLLTVALLALATRGMHIDGLADTVDGLGCYGPPERALKVMRDGGAGPFGVAALVVAIGAQALAFGVLAEQSRWLAIVLAIALGRVAVVLACRRGAAAATDTGFGALVAGTQPLPSPILWTVALAAVSVWAVPGLPWLGPMVVLAVLLATTALTRHCARRFGGLTGDVLGAVIEISTVLAAAALSLRL